jgi:hypothetical protein
MILMIIQETKSAELLCPVQHFFLRSLKIIYGERMVVGRRVLQNIFISGEGEWSVVSGQ